MEFLGIKHLIESGQLSSKQYIDLVPDAYPGESSEDTRSDEADRGSVPQSVLDKTAAGGQPKSSDVDMQANLNGEELPPVPVQDKATDFREAELPQPVDQSTTRPDPDTVDPETGYGPVRPRRRILQKDGPMALYRPGRMADEDFQEMMQEIVPASFRILPNRQKQSHRQSLLLIRMDSSVQLRTYQSPPSLRLRSRPQGGKTISSVFKQQGKPLQRMKSPSVQWNTSHRPNWLGELRTSH